MTSKFENRWLPVTKKEIEYLDWDQPDVIICTGDAYVDHPSFGAAVIGRVIEDEGLRVAILPQPNWKDDLRDFRKLGRPKYFFGVTAGNMDSMVNHYTAAKRLRSNDAYTPGGKSGFRPDYPTIAYTKILKQLYPDVPVVIGGIEASMRRLTHYDYWKDSLEPSILLSSGANLLIYGMGEEPVRELVRLVSRGVPFLSLKNIPQTAFVSGQGETILPDIRWNDIVLKSYEECASDKRVFAANFLTFEKESNKLDAARLIEPAGDKNVVINPPFTPMNESDADRTYDLPYTYLPHPKYREKGLIPAYEMIKFSVNIHRGCFGGCSFCAIAAHQGKQIIRRSEESIINEIKRITGLPGFKGYISDLGGPSANMYGMKGREMELCRRCSRPSCIWPLVCKNLNTDHGRLTNLYRMVSGLDGIKKVFIGSGVRYDLLFREWNPGAGTAEKEYLKELVVNHISGWLKVAPEHTSGKVLRYMRKVPFDLFRKLKVRFDTIKDAERLNCVIVPYFISAHPGCTEKDMHELADEIRTMDVRPEQVQDFTPTPMTLSTAMYYCGFDPYSGEKMFVARGSEEKRKQKEFFFWYKMDCIGKNSSGKGKPGNYELTGRDSKKKNFREEGFMRDNFKKRGNSR